MLKEYKRNTNIGVGIGWVALTLGNYVVRTGSFGGPIIGYVLFLLGIPLFLWGCGQYARGKGYSPFWGALGLLYILGLLVLVFLPDKHKVTASTPQRNSANAGPDLRLMMLTTPPARSGEKPSEAFPRVYGILMDWPISRGQTATVFSTSSGAASLYTTSTFGIIGGEGHESVRIAAVNFVRAADSLFDSSLPTTTFPYPDADHVRFYLLTFDGVRVLDTDLTSISNRTSKYAEYFRLGQAVLTELRLITEKPKG